MPTIDKFIDGFKQFRKETYLPKQQLYRDLAAHGQSPKVMIVACSDSRVPVQNILGAESGELFVVRNVANLVPFYTEGDVHLSTTAAIEFAVKYLEIEDIIIMGHSQCFGIVTLMKNIEANEPCSITSWVSTYEDTRERVLKEYKGHSFEEKCHACERIAVMQSLEHLKEYPWIKERIDQGKLRCHGWWYDVGEGMLYQINQPDGHLVPLIDHD